MYLQQFFPFTSARQNLLRQLNIDVRPPGLILANFHHLLDFLGQDGVPLTESGLLCLNQLQPLNQRLSRSLQLGLKRPQQKSYPHINGLYLLLRATGLGQIDPTATSPRLMLDTNVLVSWAGLSPTEQYLTLLETWLLRGRPEIIGEERGWSIMPLERWASFFNQIPAAGLVIGREKKQNEESLRYRPGLHNLALLELFGLVRVADGPSLPGAGWHIQRVERTLLGDA
jgi:hypothetical protein